MMYKTHKLKKKNWINMDIVKKFWNNIFFHKNLFNKLNKGCNDFIK